MWTQIVGKINLAVAPWINHSWHITQHVTPPHPGGIPSLPDWVAQEAYSHEVASFGFWPGSEALPEAAFYAYLYPEPTGYAQAEVKPKGAYYHETLREFVLPYSLVQEAENPQEVLTEFLDSTYVAGATLAGRDRYSLEI